MKLLLTLTLLLALVGTGYADTLTVQVDRDNGSTQITDKLVLTPANLGAATAAQGALADKAAGTVYYLADYASLQAAVDAATAAGGGTVMNAKGAVINITATFRPKNNVKVDLNGGTLKWTGGASGVMVENDITTYGAKFTGLYNGKLDPGANTVNVFKFHSIRSGYYGNLTLVSGNNSLTFLHILADAQADDPADGVRSAAYNTFGPFLSDNTTGGVPVVKTAIILEGQNNAGTWRVVTLNDFVGPSIFFVREKGYVFKQYCDSNNVKGMHSVTLAHDTVPGTCAIFNDSTTPSQAVDVWGEHIEHLSCEAWYPALAGQKAVEINLAGGIVVDYLGNDRVEQGTWPVNMITDNYSKGHDITYVEGYPNWIVKRVTKGDVAVTGSGSGIVYPDGSKQTSAPDSVSCGTGQHVSAYDAATGTYTCTADTSNSEGSTDANAIHKATAGEIAAVTQKTTPVSGDWLLIEDSASGNAKKRVSVGSLPSSVTISDSVTTTSSTTAASATAVKTAYDTAIAKQSPATTLAGYGITDGVTATGKTGGQTINGGTGATDILRLRSTSYGLNYAEIGGKTYFDETYGRILTSSNSAIVPSASLPASKIHIIGENTAGADDASTRQDLYSTASAFPSTAYYRARGTFSTPVKLVSGDRAGGIAARGYYGVSGSGGAFPSGGNAAIFFNTEEDFNDSNHNGMRITFETTAAASGTRTERFRISGSGMITEGLDDKTASFTVANSTSRITLATGTATVTLPKTLPAGTTSVLVTVAGAAASGVSFASESGGSLSWGDAGSTPTFTNSKTADVVCTSENASATTTAAWRCVKGGNF